METSDMTDKTIDPADYAYLAHGAFHKLQEAVRSRFAINLDWCGGEIGVIQNVLTFMGDIEQQFSLLQQITDDGYDGMYNYQHLEDMGEWLAEYMLHHRQRPSKAEVLRSARGFYFQNCKSSNEIETDVQIMELRQCGMYRKLKSEHGEIHVHAGTGEIIAIDLNDDTFETFSDIIAFDPRDMALTTEEEMDILDVGYWDQTGNYSHKRAFVGAQQ